MRLNSKFRISIVVLLAALVFAGCTGGANDATPGVSTPGAVLAPTEPMPVTGPEEVSATPEAVATLAPAVETPATAAGQDNPADQGYPADQSDPADPGEIVQSAPEDLPTPAAVPPVTLECTAPADLTPAQTEGPYFTANSPERASLLEEGMVGARIVLSGYVVNQNCQPVPGAKVDFWQADAQGNYDNQDYTLRGHQFTDENGFYRLETVIPGEYPGRPPHIHVKVQAPNGPELTSQVYFPAANNTADRIFNPALVVEERSTGVDGVQAVFNFVVAAP
jgi:hypothetical protein